MLEQTSRRCREAVQKIISQIASDTKRNAIHTDLMDLFNSITSQTGGGGVYVDVPRNAVKEHLPAEVTRFYQPETGGSGVAWYSWSYKEKNVQRVAVVYLRSSADQSANGIGRIMASYLVTAIHEMTHVAASTGGYYDHPEMDKAARSLGDYVNFDDYIQKHCVPKRYWNFPARSK